MLSKTKADRSDIHRKFDDGAPDTFGKLRNQIAHGSPSLDSSLVKEEYPALFKFVQRAIEEMLRVPGEAIGNDEDYYADLDSYLTDRFESLP